MSTGGLSSGTKTKKAFFILRIPVQNSSPYVKVLPSFALSKLRVGVCTLSQTKVRDLMGKPLVRSKAHLLGIGSHDKESFEFFTNTLDRSLV